MKRLLEMARRVVSGSRTSTARGPSGAHDAVQYPGIAGRVHRADTMLGGTTPELLAVYTRIGVGAWRVIEEAIGLIDRSAADVERLLDFGCGYGRVLRAIAQHVDPRRIDVFDVDPHAATFCADEFGVKGLTFVNGWDYAAVPFGAYDVIWAGSVFTHLDEPFTREMLALLHAHLRPNGLLIFTSHGDEALRRGPTGFFGPRVQALHDRIQAEVDAGGFCFIPYEDHDFAILPFAFERRDQFGMTWMSEAYIRTLAENVGGSTLSVLRFAPAGWEHVQDTVVLQRRPS